MPKVLLIDNYDSFTYNLLQLFGSAGAETLVSYNNQMTVEEIQHVSPSHICISPGPGVPEQAGVSMDVIKHYHQTLPILGVCLGHQCIVQAFGGSLQHASQIIHGKVSQVYHHAASILINCPSPFSAMRYHSWIARKSNLPDVLQVIAWTQEQEIMAIQHRDYPLFGIQFHPESVLTPAGEQIIQTFLQK